MDPEALMRMAIEKCRQGMAAGNSPFGCAIARGDEVVAVAHNTVLTTIDITAHAEVNALRVGCKHLGQIFLEGTTVATTCEPCPMCLAAIYWARLDRIYFAGSGEDAARAGFDDRAVYRELALPIRDRSIPMQQALREEARVAFEDWMSKQDRIRY